MLLNQLKSSCLLIKQIANIYYYKQKVFFYKKPALVLVEQLNEGAVNLRFSIIFV